jgi:hypothetical protein
MELMRVSIDRPWMDAGVFESHAWKWLQGTTYFNKLLATGVDANTGSTPPTTDVMPFVPTGLLLARRVSLSANWSNDLATSFSQQTSAGGSVGWGPFSFSGRYNSSDQNTYHKATAAGNTLSFDAPQIIGFFVQVLPKTPDAERCYKFASSNAPVPADCANLRGLLAFTSWSKSDAATSTAMLSLAKEQLRKAYTFKYNANNP